MVEQKYTPQPIQEIQSTPPLPIPGDKKGKNLDFLELFNQVPEGRQAYIPLPGEKFQEFSEFMQDLAAQTRRGVIFGYEKGRVLMLWIKLDSKQTNQDDQIDQPKFQLIDPSANRWNHAKWFENVFGIDTPFIKSRSKVLSTQQGIGKNGQKNLLYDSEEVLRLRVEFLNLPRVDSQSGVYVDLEAGTWAPAFWFTETYGISSTGMKPHTVSIRSIRGRDRLGHETILYNVDEIAQKSGDFLNLPRTDPQTKTYIDGYGDIWAPSGYFKEMTDLEYTTLYSRLQSIRTIEARGQNGHKITCYHHDEALAVLKDYMALPKVNPKTNTYLDNKGEVWMSSKALQKRYGISGDTLEKYATSTPTIKGRSSTGQEVILYNETEVVEKLQNFINLPQVDKSGSYTDQEGLNWGSVDYLAMKTGLKRSEIEHFLKSNGINTIKAKARHKSGHPLPLYEEVKALEVLNNRVSLGRIEEGNDELIDGAGETWITQKHIFKTLGSSKRIRSSLSEITTRGGLGKGGRETIFYNKKELFYRFGDILSLPRPDEDTNKYTDQDGETWAIVTYFVREFGLGNTTIHQLINDVPNVRGLSRNGQEVLLYKEAVVLERVKEFLALPRVDAKTGRLLDENGESWITASLMESEFNLRGLLHSDYLENIRHVEGRDKVNKRATLFNENELKEYLGNFSTLPRVNKETGVYADAEGQEWVAATLIVNNFRITYKRLNGFSEVKTINGRDRLGQRTILYNKQDLTEALKKNNIGLRSRISPEQADEQLRRLLEE